jgi:pimeloyl-ACP methyl ester carboxylesterase
MGPLYSPTALGQARPANSQEPAVTANALHYEMIQTRGLKFEVATAGDGDKLALLLHGFPECAQSWRHQIAPLVALGYRVWAPNLRGYGNTDRPKGVAAYNMEKLEGDVSDLIDKSSAKSVLLIGHDWGGSIAWSYAVHGTRPIDRLVVLNSPHPMVFARALRNKSQLARSWYMAFFQLPFLPELALGFNHAAFIERAIRGNAVHKEHFTDPEMELYRDNACQPGALTAMLNYYRALGRTLVRGSSRRGANIKVPTLLLWGERDHVLGKEMTAGTARFVDKLTLRTIPDASHWVQQDAPEAVNALLEEWLLAGRPEQLSTDDVVNAPPVDNS